MVCTKCQRTIEKTTLATPAVKRKNDLYYGSPAGDKANLSSSKSSATLGATGIGKSKLLSKAAKNPYAAYSSSCSTCKTKIGQGHKLCQRCAYKAGNACSVCGKCQTKSAAGSSNAPMTQGQHFSAK